MKNIERFGALIISADPPSIKQSFEDGEVENKEEGDDEVDKPEKPVKLIAWKLSFDSGFEKYDLLIGFNISPSLNSAAVIMSFKISWNMK